MDMTYKQYFLQYQTDITGDTSRQEMLPYLPRLKNILLAAGLYNTPTSRASNPADIRRKLRSQILTSFDDREILIQMINEYFNYFPQDWNPEGNTERILRPDDLYDSTEWKVKLLRYLQSGEDTDTTLRREDIAEHFGVSRNALDAHLAELKNGTYVLGRHVGIDLRRGKNTYGSTIHPVFMALNLSEVYFLSAVLPALAKGTNYEQTALTLASDVYSQLTSYAKSIIGPHCSALGIEHKHVDDTFREESDDYLYFEKSGQKCRILHGDHPKPLIGRIIHGEYNFEAEDGTKYKLNMKKMIEISEA